MKKRNLPFGFLLIIILLSGLIFTSSTSKDNPEKDISTQKVKLQSEIPTQYLAKIRNNQVTGVISPVDYLRVQSELSLEKSERNLEEVAWTQIGPDNFGGNTRAILFDNRDSQANTMFAAGTTGGIWKSTNIGITWIKINDETSCLNVSCMVQTPNGYIYAGTGESFNSEDYSGLNQMGYTSGFMGQGVFVSADGENFNLLESTKPTYNNTSSDWAFVNALAADMNSGRIYAATNTGLKYSDDQGQTWNTAKDNGGNLLALNSMDVQVGSNGMVITVIDNLCYVSENGDANHFVLQSTGIEGGLPNSGVSMIKFAIAPSDANVVYASVINLLGTTLNIYRSDDKGSTWRVILPGTPTVNIYGGYGVYANALTVYPTNPDMILIGGVNLWQGQKLQETGYFDWLPVSESVFNPNFPTYIHYLHHTYVFRPGYPNTFYAGTDGGIYKGVYSQNEYVFSSLNRGYITSQFYSIGESGLMNYVLGGSQGNGTISIPGTGNTQQQGVELWSGNGGDCAISLIDPATIVITGVNGMIMRSDDYGVNWSSDDQFPGGGITNPQTFSTPIALWENFNNENSRDSVTYHARDPIPAGTYIQVRSANSGQPFLYKTTTELNTGDSIRVKDIVTAVLFVATANNIYMTFDLHQFDQTPEWFNISNGEFGFIGTPSAIAYSRDANHLFVGTLDGRLYRISNLALAYNFERADVSSPGCIVSLQEINLLVPGTDEKVSQVITSIAVDPNNSSNVLITLGNYGNEQYVMYSENALDQYPSFSSRQGNLPHMPVYSSVIEMSNSNTGIIGTEFGIYMTENIHESSPNWVKMQSGMQSVPVFDLKQQWVMQPEMTVKLINGNEITYLVYPGTNNCGTIYSATYGRGLFYNNTYHLVGVDENFDEEDNSAVRSMKLYPNPAFSGNQISLEIETNKSCQAEMFIYDLSGKKLGIQYFELNNGNNVLSFPLSDLKQGVYIVRTSVGNESYTNKLVIN